MTGAAYGPGSFLVHGQTVPADLAAMLRTAHRDGGLNEALAAARGRGWTLRALGVPLDIRWQAVQQRIHKADPGKVADWSERVPEAPRRPQPRPKPTALAVPPAVAAELARRWKIATTVNGATPLDDPRRRVSIELSRSLADLRTQGYTYQALANAVGCRSPEAIRQRLGRHGHEPLPPSVKTRRYRGIRNSGPGTAAWRQEVA